jgi:hypothetical protein
MLAEVVLVSLTLISWFGISKDGRKIGLERITQSIGSGKLYIMDLGVHSISANCCFIPPAYRWQLGIGSRIPFQH